MPQQKPTPPIPQNVLDAMRTLEEGGIQSVRFPGLDEEEGGSTSRVQQHGPLSRYPLREDRPYDPSVEAEFDVGLPSYDPDNRSLLGGTINLDQWYGSLPPAQKWLVDQAPGLIAGALIAGPLGAAAGAARGLAARGLAAGSRMIATKAASRRISDQMTKRIIEGYKYGPARPPGGITSRPPATSKLFDEVSDVIDTSTSYSPAEIQQTARAFARANRDYYRGITSSPAEIQQTARAFARANRGITSRHPASVVDKIKDEFRIWNGRMNTIPEEQRPVVQSMLDQLGQAMASKTPPKWIDDAVGYFLKNTGG